MITPKSVFSTGWMVVGHSLSSQLLIFLINIRCEQTFLIITGRKVSNSKSRQWQMMIVFCSYLLMTCNLQTSQWQGVNNCKKGWGQVYELILVVTLILGEVSMSFTSNNTSSSCKNKAEGLCVNLAPGCLCLTKISHIAFFMLVQLCLMRWELALKPFICFDLPVKSIPLDDGPCVLILSSLSWFLKVICSHRIHLLRDKVLNEVL